MLKLSVHMQYQNGTVFIHCLSIFVRLCMSAILVLIAT